MTYQGCDSWLTFNLIFMQKTLIDGVAKTAKEVIEAIDDEKLSTTFKVIEGDVTTE